jgi:hypothetical protein
MNRLKIITVALLLGGCTAQAQNPSSSIPSPIPSVTPTPQVQIAPGVNRFTLKLMLTEKEDLKVKQGDVVVKDQILADRARDRQRLESQKKQVQIQLERLKQAPIQPLAPRQIPGVAAFPAPSFLEEQAEIDRLQIQVERATRDRDLQQRYLDTVQALENIPASTLAHESEKLKQRENALREKDSELQVARAKLDKSKKDYEYREYQYSLELSRRAIDIQRQEQEYSKQMQEFEKNNRDREFQISQVTSQLQTLETQLAALATVRSQYNAKIQRIKFVEQNNTTLAVELTLLTDDIRDFTRPSQATTSSATPFNSAGFTR